MGEGRESAVSTFKTFIAFKRAFTTVRHSIMGLAVMLSGLGGCWSHCLGIGAFGLVDQSTGGGLSLQPEGDAPLRRDALLRRILLHVQGYLTHKKTPPPPRTTVGP